MSTSQVTSKKNSNEYLNSTLQETVLNTKSLSRISDIGTDLINKGSQNSDPQKVDSIKPDKIKNPSLVRLKKIEKISEISTSELLHQLRFTKLDELLCQEAKKRARIRIDSRLDKEYIEALEIHTELVKKEQGYEEALILAQKGMKRKNAEISEYALELYAELVKKGQGYDAALKAAEKGMKRNNSAVHGYAVELYIELVKKGQGNDLAIKAAQKGLRRKNLEVREIAFKLLIELVQKKQGYKEAEKALISGKLKKNISTCKPVYNLSMKLVEKGFAIDKAIAIIDMQDLNKFPNQAMIDLLSVLVKRGYCIAEAKTLCKIHSKDKRMLSLAADLKSITDKLNQHVTIKSLVDLVLDY